MSQPNLDALSPDDWNRLFALLPKIEKAKTARSHRRDKQSRESFMSVVHETTSVIGDLGILPVFDWMSWEKGQKILADETCDCSRLDATTLCKLLTTIYRADGFSEGYLESCFENGAMEKIIRALQRNVRQKLAERIKSALFGLAVGDALGVPVEFVSREALRQKPIADMVGYGTYHLPAGTWSDDSSLAFCLAEALTKGFDLKEIAQNFVKWLYESYWTARGRVFDVGIATRAAIVRLANGENPERAGSDDENSNGNGSLMRILPLVFYVWGKPIDERFEIARKVSSITHRHIRSVIACFYYLEFARDLLYGKSKFEIYERLRNELPAYLASRHVSQREISVFDRLLKRNIYALSQEDISSSGYVVHTLEASVWSLLTTKSYEDAVLKAVNLGGDSDTMGAVTGGLAGLLYGYEGIPKNWVEGLARAGDIENLAERLASALLNGSASRR
ncbi:MAG: ADP-ribosylglycohydrolase family protein [Chloroherpetonaceae bacterium]|nr:ADP-ribosylglycohydrolase family protein [Chloroherpetonaceae bacterium]MDW8438100.1 ADP-ribosylglycohydrolase family protein [Chloroherpetonaceae bacterium]